MSDDSASPQEELRALRHQLKATLKHENRKLEKQKEELKETSRHDWYSQLADSLLADPSSAPRGSSQATIINVHTEQIEQISLNPKFDAHQNAELLYRKAKKGKRGHEIAVEKAEATEKLVESIREKITAIDELFSDKSMLEEFSKEQFQKIEEQCLPYLPNRPDAAGAKKEVQKESVPYKRFVIDGWEIFLGKNSTQNDELSTRFAKPSDIWLHVAGHAGSHVVIRRPKNSPPPPAEVVTKAAQLAVWFSKAKHTSFAEVHVTEARFVRKRRHAPPGEVIAERCKAVRVEPKNPQDMFPSGMYSED